MRVAFDLDGVLVDLETVLAGTAERMFGPAAPALAPQKPESALADAPNGAPEAAAADAAPEDEPVPPLVRQLTASQQRQLWQRVLQTENFWETLDEAEPGIIGRLAALALERRWEVIFVTQRPSSAGATCQLQSQRWLARHGFTLPSVFVIHGSRGKIAAALGLDVVVDDRPENCLDVVVESKARAFLVWRGDVSAAVPARAKQLNIEVAGSVAECLETLAGERDEKAPGLLDRLKRLLGS